MHVKKGDTVIVITGKDKGKRGVVLEVLPKKGKVKVEGVHIVTRHVKARAQGQKSGRIQQEAFIDISNISLVDKSKKERTTSKKSKDQE